MDLHRELLEKSDMSCRQGQESGLTAGVSMQSWAGGSRQHRGVHMGRRQVLGFWGRTGRTW